MASKKDRIRYIPIDERDRSTVRAVILARSSNPGARPEDMESQVTQCADFIRDMGWRLAFPPYSFTESKTGMRNVERPVLDKVLKLAMDDEIDVIVCLRLARIDRRPGRRYQAVETARDYGVEFRFPKYAADRGRYPGGVAGLLEQFRDDIVDEQEAKNIHERMNPGRMRRFEDGLPHGGANGPNYGYTPGERSATRHGRPKGVLKWEVDEEKAQWVRWMYTWVDEHAPAEVSLRGMARELDRRGVLTPTGGREWAATQIKHILRNPKYCGRGRNLRYAFSWSEDRDQDTKLVREVMNKVDRLRDPVEWEKNTLPISPEAIPAIVTPEQWERVQVKLKEAAALNNRGGLRRTDEAATSTLLDGGYLYCAECGGKMNRHWMKKYPFPYYRCFKSADRPSHQHVDFSVPARHVDALARRLLAVAMTDPEKILELASAAEGKWTEANADALLAASALAAYRKRMADITAEHDKLRAALSSLKGTGVGGDAVSGIEMRLLQLDQDRATAESDYDRAMPARDHTQARADFLQAMFTRRNDIFDLSGDTLVVFPGEEVLRVGELRVRTREDGTSERYSVITTSQAAALLGVTVEELEPMGFRVERGETLTLDNEFGVLETGVQLDVVETVDVVELLLCKMPRDKFRRLLHDLDAVVKITRGRSRADIAAGVKKIPLADRVYLELLDTVIIRTDVKKLKTSSYECLCSFGPSPGAMSTRITQTPASPCR